MPVGSWRSMPVEQSEKKHSSHGSLHYCRCGNIPSQLCHTTKNLKSWRSRNFGRSVTVLCQSSGNAGHSLMAAVGYLSFYQAGFRKLMSRQCANIDVVEKTFSQLNWWIARSPRKPSALGSIPAKRPKIMKPRQRLDGVLALQNMTAMRCQIDWYNFWDCMTWNVSWNLFDRFSNTCRSIHVLVQQTAFSDLLL